MSDLPNKPERFSPRDFLRARRPERFSDSMPAERAELNRSVLEYHIDSLTSRNQENDFELFARRLAECEVCPNLISQTGPMGGGDSKVDAETIPVADALTLTWYTGIGREAANERWAFAFSAKKQWKPKVQSDVAKLVDTNRGYAKAFFVTNQYVRAKDRAKMEDELREAHNLDVRILDRTWILDRVFEHNRQALAIEELHIDVPQHQSVRTGPLDLQRERDLTELERAINDKASTGENFGGKFVDDCLEAAILARGLERPRVEVDGRFGRAIRVADKYGSNRQKLECVYEHAWTMYWWYEDYYEFSKIYDALEKHAVDSSNADDLECLYNLWTCLHTASRTGHLTPDEANLEQRSAVLAKALERIASLEDRPSNSLQAHTLRLHMQLMESMPDNVDPILNEFEKAILEAEGLVGYPLMTVAQILTEIGSVLGESPAYRQLFDTLVRVTSTRKGEVAAAKMLAARGGQELDADRPYEAIKSLGSALARLYKEESKPDLIRTLYLCSAAYERAGLLWAARGSAVTAASLAMLDFRKPADITPTQAAIYHRMKWLELQLGRLPHTLLWHEIDSLLLSVLKEQGYNIDPFIKRHMDFDATLGMLLLRTELWDLGRLTRLPDVLEQLGLEMSAIALQFALGHEDTLPEELFPKSSEGETSYDFVRQWRDQPASESLPPTPMLYEQQTVTIQSNVLGCSVIINSENGSPFIELAESFLAALESLLSTGLVERIIAREPKFLVTIRQSEFAESPFQFQEHDDEDVPTISVRCTPFDAHNMPREMQSQVRNQMFELLTHVLARAFLIDNYEDVLTRLFRDDRAQDRALLFTSSFVTLSNVVGSDPKSSISAWITSKLKEYPLIRDTEWDAADRRDRANDSTSARPRLADDAPPSHLNLARAKHDQLETISLIRIPLWEKAQWRGVAYLYDEAGAAPPVMAPIFVNAEAAGDICRLWRAELGESDDSDRLRITVIRGVNKSNPSEYRVIIGVNPEATTLRPNTKFFIMPARIHTMTPSADTNLERFLKALKDHGRYILAHAIADDAGNSIRPVFENAIEKHSVHVRSAWEIGTHDLDGVGIMPDDDPIIPETEQNAPVVELLDSKRQQ